MATRKLYREIAESIRTNMIGMTPKQAEGAAAIARAVADDLKYDNYSFNYQTFYEAAGLDGWGQPVRVKRERKPRRQSSECVTVVPDAMYDELIRDVR